MREETSAPALSGATPAPVARHPRGSRHERNGRAPRGMSGTLCHVCGMSGTLCHVCGMSGTLCHVCGMGQERYAMSAA